MNFGQEKTITGTVISAENGLPLLGATITVKGTSIGVTADFDGKYTIKANADNILVFSYVGYSTTEVKVADKQVINVSLTEDAALLDEIVITGYGKQTS